jgi:hypothetical protein
MNSFPRKSPLVSVCIALTCAAFTLVSLQDAQAWGWGSCQRKNGWLPRTSVAGCVGGMVCLMAEGAAGGFGASLGTMLTLGGIGASSVMGGMYAMVASKNPSSIKTREAVVHSSAETLHGLYTLVKAQLSDAEIPAIERTLQDLDDEGRICNIVGKYYPLEKVAGIVVDRLNGGASAPPDQDQNSDSTGIEDFRLSASVSNSDDASDVPLEKMPTPLEMPGEDE